MIQNSCKYICFSLIVFIAHSCQSDRKNQGNKQSSEYSKNDLLGTKKDSLNTIQIDSLNISDDRELMDSLVAIPESVDLDSGQKLAESKPKKRKALPKAKIEFQNEFIDFGVIQEGDVIKQEFYFKNVGNAPLEIFSAKGSCGCTQPSYPFVEIPPEESGFIGVEYNSVGKSGDQKVNIRISTNARKSDYVLYLKGRVQTKEESEETKVDSLSDS